MCLEPSVDCGKEGPWEEDCPQADVDMPQAKRRVTFSRPPAGVGVSQAQSTNLMGVTMTMPEGHAHFDCGTAIDSIGEVAAARTAQAITASGETRRPAVVDKIQRFKFGGDGDPVEASFAVPMPVQIGDTKTWIEVWFLAVLLSRRWLSLSIDVW